MVPGKIMIPNILALIASMFSVISSLLTGDYNIEVLYFTLITILTTISIILFFYNDKKKSYIAIIIQFIWLGYFFKKNFIKDYYYLITIIPYFSAIIYFLYLTSFKKKKEL